MRSYWRMTRWVCSGLGKQPQTSDRIDTHMTPPTEKIPLGLSSCATWSFSRMWLVTSVCLLVMSWCAAGKGAWSCCRTTQLKSPTRKTACPFRGSQQKVSLKFFARPCVAHGSLCLTADGEGDSNRLRRVPALFTADGERTSSSDFLWHGIVVGSMPRGAGGAFSPNVRELAFHQKVKAVAPSL